MSIWKFIASERGSGSCRLSFGNNRLVRPAEVEPQGHREEREERANGVEQGIVRRSGTARNERLMNFVKAGIARGDKPGRKSPGPAPSRARAANGAKKEQIEDEVFAEVRGLANQMMDETQRFMTQAGEEPMQQRNDDSGGVLGGERVGGERKDDAGPHQCRPPGTNPSWNQELVKLRLHFGQVRRRAGIAPGL